MDDLVGVGMMDTGVCSTRVLTLVCARLFSGRSATITTDARLQGPSSNTVAPAKPEASSPLDRTPCQLSHYLPLVSCYIIRGKTSRAVNRGITVNVGDVVLCVCRGATHRRRSSEAARRESAHGPCQYSHWWKGRTHLASMNGSRQY